MRYALILSFFAIVVLSCNHKAVPAKTPTPAAVVPPVNTTTTVTTTVSTTVSADKMAAMGHDTYTAKCGRCHELKKVDNYTVTQWDPILANMAVKANLNDTEKANVLAYVDANAKK